MTTKRKAGLGRGLDALIPSDPTRSDDSTYLERSTRSYRLPGILVERMRFTL